MLPYLERKEYYKQYYLNNKAAYQKSALKRDRKKYKAFVAIRDALKAVPCLDCGGTFPPECMDFDHRVPNEKEFNISEGSFHTAARLLKEVEKCDIICANCHRIRTKTRNLMKKLLPLKQEDVGLNPTESTI